MANAAPKTIDDYIRAAPPSARPILRRIRRVVAAAVPAAEERISYRMPAFFADGIVIYFAAFKAHIGVFPPVRGDAALLRRVAPFAGPKGNLRFPLDRPVPYALIARIAKLRAARNRAQRRKRRVRA